MITTTTTSRTIICPLVWQKSQHGGAIWCVPRWAAMAHKTKSLYQWLRVQMRGTIYTLHYILSKGAMKCVWDIVSVHVSLHGISDCRCCYKVFANEFCQRQLWTWWNGQRRDEKLALCGLGRCCIATPASFHTLCLTCAACPKKQRKKEKKKPRPPFHYQCCTRGRVIRSSRFETSSYIMSPIWSQWN